MVYYDPKKIEKEVLEYWMKEDIAGKLEERRKGKKKFFLLDGPPYVNGTPHVGHVKTTTYKDIWTRFKYMQGYSTFIQPGFDCHGLPVEVAVEKELGITSKSDIEEKIGIEEFDKKCLEKVRNNESAWLGYYKKLGAWRGFFAPYLTYKDYYIESGWWTAKKLHEKSMLYAGEKPIYWCPHCETALSGYEVSDSYTDVEDPSVFVKFKVKGEEKTYFIVWTTTPWTLPANVALFVHPKEEYVKVKVGEEYYILGAKRVPEVLKDTKYKIVKKFKGVELDGMEYEPLLDVEQQKELGEKAHKIYLSISIMKKKQYKKHKMKESEEGKEEFEEFVTMDEGSGIVHCAPGHGATDYLVGQHYGLPAVSPVDEKGRFTEKVKRFEGVFVKDADKEIIELLKKENKLLREETIVHSYPLCWRCKSKLIFRMSKQWYFSIEPIKQKMIEANKKVNWMPESGREMFANWLEGSGDWCISQQRYWGIPMPIWVCDKCGKTEVIGSKEELLKKAINAPKDINDLHRHNIDKIELKCDECGGTMHRVKDIFNVWFDSGISPWASMGYPYKNKELFEKLFPVDLINESQDQIRGWFYALMFYGIATFDIPSYKNVAMMGWVVDENGEKMSKSRGNVISALEGIEKLGADTIRLYFSFEVPPSEVQRFSFSRAKEVKKSLNILLNILEFYTNYRGEIKPEGIENMKEYPVEDRWIISANNSLTKKVTKHLENFEFHKAGREIIKFVNDKFSRTYIKLVRDRMDIHSKDESKSKCINTINYCLLSTAKLLAPITPFISEYIYSKLKEIDNNLNLESIHFELYPEADDTLIDLELEEKMERAAKIIEAIMSARQKAKLRLRWPIPRAIIKLNEVEERPLEEVEDTIRKLANVKKVEIVKEQVDEEKFTKAEFEGGTIFIDNQLDKECEEEAIIKETTRAIQEARKKNGFKVQEKINLTLRSNEKIQELFERRKEEIAKTVGAEKIDIGILNGEVEANAKFENVEINARFSRVSK